MTEPLPDTWHSRDLPVLRAAVAGVDADIEFNGVSIEDIESATGLSQDDAQMSLRALDTAGFIERRQLYGAEIAPRIVAASARARELSGTWPTAQTALDRMIVALEDIAANTNDEDTRTRARRFGEWLKGAGSTVGLTVAAAAITGQMPN